MILEKVEKNKLMIQGFVNCKVVESTAVLRELRLDFPKFEVQLFRADRIAGKDHLLFAAMGAVRAFRQDRQRARTLAVELLIYASCQRQISKAIRLLGVGPHTSDVALVALTNDTTHQDLRQAACAALDAHQDDNVIEILSKKKVLELKKAFDISAIEVAATMLPYEEERSVLKRLIIERTALMSVEK